MKIEEPLPQDSPSQWVLNWWQKGRKQLDIYTICHVIVLLIANSINCYKLYKFEYDF